MDKQAGNYSQPSLSTALHVHHDYSLDHHQHQRRPQQQQQAMRLPFPFPRVDGDDDDDDDDDGETSVTGNHNVNNGMVMMSSTHTHHDYMLINNNNTNKNNNNIHPAHDQQISTTSSDTCLHKLSFEDQFAADFGGPDCKNQSAAAPKIIISSDQYHHHHQHHQDQVEANNIDPVYFLKFPVLLNHKDGDHDHHQGQQPADDHLIMAPPPAQLGGAHDQEEAEQDQEEGGGEGNSVQLLRFAVGAGDELEVDDHVNIGDQNNTNNNNKKVMKRKRGRSIKTSEEVESQRMTHIAVERNRRKQMNEHLRVLRSLMPGSYVQRGDQASIIGGAIEFVRELEQLLQCLESQKRRRLINMQGDNNSITSMPIMQMPLIMPIQQQQHDDDQVPPIFFPAPHHDHLPIISNDDDHHHVLVLQQDHNFDQQTTTGGSGNTSTTLGLLEREETAEKKSSLADVEVKVIGFDAMIKILSRRRPGQLIHIIAALQDLHLNILHTNITTIEQTVLYSFNVKVASECRFTAEDIASSVQQIFAFIHANTIV